MIYLLIFAAILILDQVTKYLAVLYLKGTEGIPLVGNAIYLYYVENRGAAFGILQNQKALFVILTVLVLGGFLAYILYKKPKSKLLLLSFAMIAGGALGNLIDRLRISYVVDMFEFRFIHFPVFNVADMSVVIGTVLLCITILFYDNNKMTDSKATTKE